MPFLDSQTGVAQNHSALFMHKRQRMPGLYPGQIYSYPRARWRKRRRQYLTLHSRVLARATDSLLEGEGDLHNISQVENPALQDTDSKDSQLLLKDEVPKDWFYDEQEMLDMDAYDEPDPDSDFDYEESYSKRSKRRRTSGRGRGGTDSPSTPRRGKGGGRGRKKTLHNFDPMPGDPDKPFGCELCGARYKTRPGLTYHYGHSHRDGASDDNSRESNAPTTSMQVGGPAINATPIGGFMGLSGGAGSSGGGSVGGGACEAPPLSQHPGHVYQDSYVTFLNHPAGSPARRGRQAANAAPPVVPPQQPPSLPPNLPPQIPPSSDDPPMPVLVPEKKIKLPSESGSSDATPSKDKAAPSPYCDFCLGDARENKKTGGSEELVSCSDCGRSGKNRVEVEKPPAKKGRKKKVL